MKSRLLYALAPLALIAGCGQQQPADETGAVDEGTMSSDVTTSETTTMPADGSAGTSADGTMGTTPDGTAQENSTNDTAAPSTPNTGEPTTADKATDTPPR